MILKDLDLNVFYYQVTLIKLIFNVEKKTRFNMLQVFSEYTYYSYVSNVMRKGLFSPLICIKSHSISQILKVEIFNILEN